MIVPAAVLAHAVSIYAPGAGSAHTAAAVEGCNQALGGQRCVADDELGGPGEWVATITWSDGEQRFARVELTRAGEADEAVTREVEFGPDDPLEQRYRAVGLIVAAYVVATGSAATEETQADVPKPPAAAGIVRGEVAPAPPVPRTKGGGWGLDGATAFGTGFRGAGPALGANLRPWWRPFAGPLLVLGQLRWTGGEHEGLRADWLSSSLGGALRLEPWALPLRFEARLEGVAQRVLLRANEAGSRRSERASSWRFGGRAGVDLALSLSESFAFVVGGDVSLLRPQLVVDVAAEARGREAVVVVQGLVGVRFQRE